jgi:alpha-glucosidase
VQDPYEKNVPGIGVGRDGCRTPMQWDTSRHAGFSTAEPWLPLAANWRTQNVATERADPASLLNLYRRLIALRRQSQALSEGNYQSVAATGDLLAYLRQDGSERILVLLNLGTEPVTFEMKDGDLRGQLLISSHPGCDDQRVEGVVDLRAHEAVVIRLEI